MRESCADNTAKYSDCDKIAQSDTNTLPHTYKCIYICVCVCVCIVDEI